MAYRFDGKTVVITGSTSGIGREMARQFAQAGASIVVHGTNAHRAAELVEELVHAGAKAVACLGDIADPETAEELAECAVEHFGRLDICVANAGILGMSPFLEMKPGDFRKFLDIHVLGAFATTQAAAKKMVALGNGGRILYVSSVSGLNAMLGYSAYCSAKAAIFSLCRVAAVELAEHGITANFVAPGPVANESMQELWGAERLRERCRTIPAGRLAEAEEVAKAAMYLASEDARYVTGQGIFVDGGALAAGLYSAEVGKRRK